MNKRKNKPGPCWGRRLCGRPGLSPDGVARGCAPAPPPGNPTGRLGPWVAWAGVTTRAWGRRSAGGPVCRGICRWRGPGAPTAAPAALCRGHRVVPSASPGAAEAGAGVAFRCQGPHTAGSHPTHCWHLLLGTGEPMAPLLRKPSRRGQKQRFGGALGFTPAFLLVGQESFSAPVLVSALTLPRDELLIFLFISSPLLFFFFSSFGAALSSAPSTEQDQKRVNSLPAGTARAAGNPHAPPAPRRAAANPHGARFPPGQDPRAAGVGPGRAAREPLWVSWVVGGFLGVIWSNRCSPGAGYRGRARPPPATYAHRVGPARPDPQGCSSGPLRPRDPPSKKRRRSCRRPWEPPRPFPAAPPFHSRRFTYQPPLPARPQPYF